MVFAARAEVEGRVVGGLAKKGGGLRVCTSRAVAGGSRRA